MANSLVALETADSWKKKVLFENCFIESFSAIGQRFEKQVTLKNCHFRECQFTFAYFFGGLIIDNCTFQNCLDFQAGGHNKTGNPIKMTNNNFGGFMNFFDCWYENEVEIMNNKFHKGTNLLGIVHGILVSFDIEPVIKDNVGQLDFDNEGEIE